MYRTADTRDVPQPIWDASLVRSTRAAKSADTKSKGTQMDYLKEAKDRMGRSEDYDTASAFALIAIAETLRLIRDQLATRRANQPGNEADQV
jgi:hypothetical protein